MSADCNANFNCRTAGICSFILTDIAEQQNLNFNSLTLPNFRNGLTVFQIPPQRQAPNVSGKLKRHKKIILNSNKYGIKF